MSVTLEKRAVEPGWPDRKSVIKTLWRWFIPAKPSTTVLASQRQNTYPSQMLKITAIFSRCVLVLSVTILFLTATAKLISVWKLGFFANSLSRPNIVFSFLSEGHFLVVASFAEYGLVALLLTRHNAALRFGLLTWFSLMSLFYRYVVSATNGEMSCHCSGVWVGTSQDIADVIGFILHGILTAIGLGGLLGVTATYFCSWVCARPETTMKRTGTMWLVIGYVLILGAISGQGQTSDVFYEAHIQISQTNLYYTNASPTKALLAKTGITTWSARCVFGPGKWFIETLFSPTATHTYSFDGTNVYHVTELKQNRSPFRESETKLTEAFPVLPLADLRTSTDWAFLTITPSEHPLSDFGANLPWLVFCSGNYLRSPDRLIPLAGAEIRHVQSSFGFRDSTLTFPDGLGLPQKMELLASENLLRESPLHESLLRGGRSPSELQVALHPVPSFPEGFIAARYTTLEHTNLSGCNIPTEFSYEQFLPGGKGSPLLTLAVLGKVTELRPAEHPRFTLSASQRYSVVDYRFRHRRKLVDAIRYPITNGLVLDKENMRLRSQYESAVSRAPVDPIAKAQFGIYSLFFVLISGPVIAALWWQVNKKKQKKEHPT